MQVKELLVWYEELAQTAKDGKWMMGFAEPTLLDIAIAPLLEITVLMEGGVLGHVFDKLDVRNSAPGVLAYVEKFRSDPLFAPHVI